MFKLENVLPWGHSFQEYVNMFNLTPNDLKGSILDCGAGPSSFNAQMTRSGGKVISCDPIYQFTVEEIQKRIKATYPIIMSSLEENFANSCYFRDVSSGQRCAGVSPTKEFYWGTISLS